MRIFRGAFRHTIWRLGNWEMGLYKQIKIIASLLFLFFCFRLKSILSLAGSLRMGLEHVIKLIIATVYLVSY